MPIDPSDPRAPTSAPPIDPGPINSGPINSAPPDPDPPDPDPPDSDPADSGTGDLDPIPLHLVEPLPVSFLTPMSSPASGPGLGPASGPIRKRSRISESVFYDPHRMTVAGLREQAGGEGVAFTDLDTMHNHLRTSAEVDTLVLGTNLSEPEAFAIADYLRLHRPTLGVILIRTTVTTPLLQDALRAGLLDVLHHHDTHGLQTAIKRSAHLAAARRDHTPHTPTTPQPTTHRGHTITVFSAKGGSGKTTLATNLAATLAHQGRHHVCLLDLDLTFGDVAIALQLFPARTIADAVPLNGAIDSTAVAAMLTHHSAGLSAIVAPTEPSAADTIHPTLITHLLTVLRNDFDYIVIDTPAAFNDQVLAALDDTDLITLIVTPDVPALKTLKITLETLLELSYPKDKFRLVLNRSDSRVGISHTEIEKTANLPITAHIPSSRDVPATTNRGIPITQDDPKHPVSTSIQKFAETQILAALPPGTAPAATSATSSIAAHARRHGRSPLRKRRQRR